MKRLFRALALLYLLGGAQALHAHNLIRETTEPTSWSDPLQIERPDVSQVYYARLERDRRRVWFRFSGKAGDRIWFQVGVPLLDRLAGLKPQAALVGPGLRSTDIGFELPPGLGSLVFRPSDRPRAFYEEFTGTSSWIWIEEEYVLPASGTWYLVAYPESATGDDDKLWLAIGSRESFGVGDLLRLGAIKRFVRAFHEVR